MYCIQHCFIFRLSDSAVPENAGIKPRTVATSALAEVALYALQDNVSLQKFEWFEKAFTKLLYSERKMK
jgi:hypothetical protein